MCGHVGQVINRRFCQAPKVGSMIADRSEMAQECQYDEPICNQRRRVRTILLSFNGETDVQPTGRSVKTESFTPNSDRRIAMIAATYSLVFPTYHASPCS